MFQIESIHHVSLSVTNLERSKHFYGTVLGLRELKRPPFDFPGAWYEVGSQQIHLIVFPKSETIRKSGSGINSMDGHFAIRVKDYDGTRDYLQKAGVQLQEKPNSKSGFAQIFCVDPDNNLIEFHVER